MLVKDCESEYGSAVNFFGRSFGVGRHVAGVMRYGADLPWLIFYPLLTGLGWNKIHSKCSKTIDHHAYEQTTAASSLEAVFGCIETTKDIYQ